MTAGRAAAMGAAQSRMAASAELAWRGYDELMAALAADLDAPAAVGKAMAGIGLLVAGEAAKRAPVDTGRLRSSLTYEVEEVSDGWITRVGSNVSYAPAMEFGTGANADGGLPGKPVHRPPAAALDRWAERHGLPNGYVVARAIGRKGGLKPRRYLRGAIEDQRDRIVSGLDVAAAAISRRWANG